MSKNLQQTQEELFEQSARELVTRFWVDAYLSTWKQAKLCAITSLTSTIDFMRAANRLDLISTLQRLRTKVELLEDYYQTRKRPPINAKR